MNRYNLKNTITKTTRKDVADIIGSPRNVHKSPTGVPQFPAFNSNMSMTDVRKFIQMQPRCTGVPFNATAGNFLIQNIQLPGDARLFLGLVFTKPPTFDTDAFTMTLNNNRIIDNGNIGLHSYLNGYSITTQYFEYLQPLTGKDIFAFQLNTAAGMQGMVQLHYI